MPKTVRGLNSGEEHDKEAQEHLKNTIEFEEMAVKAVTPADRKRYGENAGQERNLAMEALEQGEEAMRAKEIVFDIYSGVPEEKSVWIESVRGLAAAKERMEQIADQKRGNYFIFDPDDHRVHAQIEEVEQGESN